MSTGPIDPIRTLVNERITKQMYGPKKRYINDRGDFLHGLLQDDIVDVVKTALADRESTTPGPEADVESREEVANQLETIAMNWDHRHVRGRLLELCRQIRALPSGADGNKYEMALKVWCEYVSHTDKQHSDEPGFAKWCEQRQQ